MSLKRKHSSFETDTTSSPLPLPLTTRPLDPRADSPTSSMSSRSSNRPKRFKRDLRLVDVHAMPDITQPIAGPSNASDEIREDEVRDVEAEMQLWKGSDLRVSRVPFAIRSRSRGGNAVAGPSKIPAARLASLPTRPSTPPPSNLLSRHSCPICFSTVTNACLTPCGHVLCGACLFASVKSGIQRSLNMGIPIGGEGTTAKCVFDYEAGMNLNRVLGVRYVGPA